MIIDLLMEVAVASAMFALSCWFPFRQLDARPQVAWDIAAVLCVLAFATVAGHGLTWLYDGLLNGFERWYDMVESWPTLAIVTGFVLSADLLSYWAHRLLHTRLFWHSHAFHHSSRYLYVLSGLRGSFIHVLLLFAGPLASLALFPLNDVPLILVLIAASQVINQHLTHSNISIPYSRYLELVFVTPRYHFVHHAADRGLSNSNFGFLLSIWDRLFGTYTDPAAVGNDEPLGLDYQNSLWRLLLGMPPGTVQRADRTPRRS